MTNINKQEIINLIHEEKNRLGSMRAVATKCKISETAISQLLSGTYNAKGDDIWYKIGSALDYNPSNWQIVPTTTNYMMIAQVLSDAKVESMFMAISHKAGSGKTSTIDNIVADDKTGSTYKIQCREWSKRDFLNQLAKVLGLSLRGGYMSVDTLGEQIIGFFKSRSLHKPQLIIDEADKLKPSALRYLIPLYNSTEDFLSVVIAGTDNLEKEIKRGAKNNLKGYDELDSRFGRSFIHLIGSTRSDVFKICAANGITNQETQAAIWAECTPVQATIKNGDQVQHIKVVEDMRRVKRAIKRELLKIKHAA